MCQQVSIAYISNNVNHVFNIIGNAFSPMEVGNNENFHSGVLMQRDAYRLLGLQWFQNHCHGKLQVKVAVTPGVRGSQNPDLLPPYR